MTFEFNPDRNEVLNSLPEPQQPPIEPAIKTLPEQWRLRDLLIFILFIPFALFAANMIAFIGYAVLAPVLHWA